jgi:hypothetical protein
MRFLKSTRWSYAIGVPESTGGGNFFPIPENTGVMMVLETVPPRVMHRRGAHFEHQVVKNEYPSEHNDIF